MQGVPEVLQLAIVVERDRSFVLEPQFSQKLHFFIRDIAAERVIPQEFCESRLVFTSVAELFLDEREFFRFPGRESFVKHYFHIKSREVDIPARQQRVEKGDTVGVRNIEDICVEELQNNDAHSCIALVAELCDIIEPDLVV